MTAAAFSVMEPSCFLTVAIVTTYWCIYRGRSRRYILGRDGEKPSMEAAAVAAAVMVATELLMG